MLYDGGRPELHPHLFRRHHLSAPIADGITVDNSEREKFCFCGLIKHTGTPKLSFSKNAFFTINSSFVINIASES